MVEIQVQKKPSGKAIVFHDKCLTYAELDAESNKLASYLLQRNIKKEEFIGVFCTRSIEMIIGILGILKAGGAYVTLDPEYPHTRLESMVKDTELKLILSNTNQSNFLLDQSEIINIKDVLNQNLPTTCCQQINHNNLAYVIFTSGSSGKPKASLLEHKGLINIAQEQLEIFDLNENSRILQFASLSFDAATWEWLMALCSGGCLYLLTEDEFHSPEKLNTYVKRHQITHATLPPALLPSLDLDSWQSVTHLIVAGEACPLTLAKLWAKNRHFYNAYGPSEVSICATIAKFVNSVEELHLGQPISNTCIYVLDDQLNYVNEGELYIGGVGLSRGYLNNPDLTSQKFIQNPDKESEFVQLYRTGDRVRVDSKGHLFFSGRTDKQIKINGHRIELEEIESILLSHPDVNQAIAAVNNDTTTQLLTWVVANKISSHQYNSLEASLRQYLSEKLPRFMQPNHIFILEKIPLTANKKIDFHALPIKTHTLRKQMSYTQPENDIEQQICLIWQEVLNISEIGTEDNFYWLGGNSLTAAKIISKINKISPTELMFSEFIEAGNIKNIAKLIIKPCHNIWQLPEVQPIKSGQHLPISSIQKSILFMQSVVTQVPYCNTPIIFHIDGNLNISALKKSIHQEIQSHETLHSLYSVNSDGDWNQTIQKHLQFELEFIDFSDHSKSENRIKDYLAQKQNDSFNLDIDIPLKSFLIKLDNTEYILGFIFHQIAFDGKSTSLFMQNISNHYQQFITSDNPTNSLLHSHQYSEYAHWHKSLIAHQEYQTGLEWWKTYLKDAPELHSIALDYSRPTQQTYIGKTAQFFIEEKQYLKIQHFAQNQQVSLFTLIQAAFSVFVAHYSNKTDVVTGTVSNGRLKTSFQNTIGNFANILVFRENTQDNPTFARFLQRVKENIDQLFKHEFIGFDDIVEQIKPKRSPSHGPLVQLMLVMQDDSQHTLKLGGLDTKHIPYDTGVAKFDLALHLYPSKNHLQLCWEYDTSIFKETTISRLNIYFLNVLMQGVNHPGLPLSELELLPKSQLETLNKNSVSYNPGNPVNVYNLFLDNVNAIPLKTAIYEGFTKFSYKDLSKRVDDLSNQLLSFGVIPNTQKIIAVYLDKSADLLASMLAIFKLGHIYLPIDPSHPRERIHYILNDANATAIITNDKYHTTFTTQSTQAFSVFIIDESLNLNIRQPQSSNPDVDNIAYVLYTSGSTGKPKGVMVSHRSLYYSLQANSKCLGFHSEDIIPAIGSQGFGVSILEFLMPLTFGASVRLIKPETVKDLEKLITETQDVSIMHAVPSLLKNWLQTVSEINTLYPNLRLIFTGGEAVPIELLHQLASWKDQLQIYVTYGMTEATVICASYSASKEHRGHHYIGKAYPGTYFRVLNQYLKQQPPGVAGELYIGGACLASGYLHKSELTKSKFIVDPENENEILYQTGDLVRIAEDDNLEFLGRVDNQINLRGMRIEYGEIESRLHEINEIQQAIVSVKPLPNGEDTLVSYIRFKPQQQLAISSIREHLAKFLPDYMCPDHLIVVENLPLNPNGKIDRMALPPLVISTEGSQAITETEKLLTKIWQDLLTLVEVPTDKSFFELGGNSLLIAKAINRIRLQLEIDLSIAILFNNPSIQALANEIDKIKCAKIINKLICDNTNEKFTELINEEFTELII